MRGFTPCLQHELQLLGLLAPGPFESHGRSALPTVRPFAASPPLLRPLLSPRSAHGRLLNERRPFRREARLPRIRALAFPARPPDLRRRPLVTRASRSFARSPWSASPAIRFLFVGPQFRSPLPSASPSRLRPCGSLGFL